jgi:hypothetical protein
MAPVQSTAAGIAGVLLPWQATGTDTCTSSTLTTAIQGITTTDCDPPFITTSMRCCFRSKSRPASAICTLNIPFGIPDTFCGCLDLDLWWECVDRRIDATEST